MSKLTKKQKKYVKKAVQKSKGLQEKTNPSFTINEHMKFMTSMAMGMAMVLAYKKGYDDAKHGKKMKAWDKEAEYGKRKSN
jgi:hypothetical protein